MSDIARRHTLVEGTGGLLTITGGKLTTYRRMAKDVVDRIVERDDRKAKCRTDEIPLSGTRPVADLVAETTTTALTLGLSAEVAASLVLQCGQTAWHVLSLVAAEPALCELLSPSAPHIAAEVVHAARSEGEPRPSTTCSAAGCGCPCGPGTQPCRRRCSRPSCSPTSGQDDTCALA